MTKSESSSSESDSSSSESSSSASSSSSSSASAGRKVQSSIRPKKKIRLGKSSSPSPMSSSSHLLSVKHDVYVRVVNIDDQLEWYSYDFNASDEEEERKRGLRGFGDYLPVPTPLKTKKISRFSSCATVDSTIYCIGGQRRDHSGRLSDKVHCLDTSMAQQSWAKGPSMLNARSDCRIAVVDGKIYVMGGTKGCVSEPWAEVFDPKSNTWAPLPSPSPKPSDFGLFSAALPYKVVVGSSEDDFLYLYNVMTKCWERLDKERYCGPYNVQPVAVGTTLFWFQESKLHAYDLFGKLRYSGPIKGLEKIMFIEFLSKSVYSPVLLHAAARDELYWICSDPGGAANVTMLRCVKFRISESTVLNDEGHLNAFAESCQSYLIRKPSLILDAVLM